MNKVCLIGRFTNDPEINKTSSDIPFTRFTLAVNRNFNNQDGVREADFINCLAWRRTAELICKYFNKGRQIAIEGRIQTGSYEDKDGNKRKSFDVVVDDITFIDKMEESKKTEKEDNTTFYTSDINEDSDPFADFGDDLEIEDNFLD